MQSKKEYVWANFQDFIKNIVTTSSYSNKEYDENSEYIRYVSGMSLPLFNGIIPKAALTLNEIDTQLEKLIAKEHPFCWWINPEISQGTEGVLEAKKLVSAGVYTGIAATVKKFTYKNPVGVDIREVTTEKEYKMWGDVIGTTFGFQGENLQSYLHGLRDFGPGKPYRHYLAECEGKGVGAMSLYCHQGICGIWNGGVIVESRGQGIGTALGTACMNEAARLGFSSAVAILMAGKMAEPLCKKLGFQEVCQILPYVYGFNPEDLEPTKNK